MSNRRVNEIRNFALRKGARVGGVNANLIGAELERLYTENGKLDAESYVNAAIDASSPLHKTLEWDDGKAGHEYRLQQARTIIRAIVVVTDDALPSQVYVKVDKHRGYQPISAVVDNLDMFTAALELLQKKVSEALNAVEELKMAAQQTSEPERMARISLAIQALHTASDAINAVH